MADWGVRMKENVVLFGKSKSQVGIVTDPDDGQEVRQRPAVILLNAGLIHRVGPNRIYVKLARRLAAMGFVVLRIDYSGVGDSKAREDHLPFEKSAILETQEAMNYLSETRGARQFFLMGHCAGAVNSFRTAGQDTRVAGAVLINPEGGDQDWSTYDHRRKVARYYQSYYGRGALLSANRWRRFFSGQASYRSIAKNVFKGILWNTVSTQFFRLRNKLRRGPASPETSAVAEQTVAGMRLIAGRGVRLLMVYSEGSTGLEHMRAMLGSTFDELQASGSLRLEIVPRSDHVFTLLRSQEELFAIIQSWAAEITRAAAIT